MRFRRSVLSLIVAAAMLAAPLAHAQDWRGKGRVDGWVKDADGNPIADAQVELTRDAGGKISAKTNKKGYWAIMGLIGGPWNIDVTAAGYETRKLQVSLSEASRIPPMEIKLDKAAPAQAAEGVAAGGAGAEAIKAIEAGNALLGEKKFAEARAEYEKAAALVPDNAAIVKGIAQTYNGEGNTAKTIETLKRAVDLDPADTSGKTLLASLMVQEGQLDEGKAMLDSLPAGAITDPAIYMNVGILFLNKKQPENAQTYLSKAIEIAPTDGDLYYFRGLAAMQAKKNPEACSDLKKFLELKPDSTDAKEAQELVQALKCN
jgi:tetratricopeptide (TPR) repeat protein